MNCSKWSDRCSDGNDTGPRLLKKQWFSRFRAPAGPKSDHPEPGVTAAARSARRTGPDRNVQNISYLRTKFPKIFKIVTKIALSLGRNGLKFCGSLRIAEIVDES